MAKHRIRIVETTARKSTVLFVVEAPTAEVAAAGVMVAYKQAAVDKHEAITLADGQTGILEEDEEVAIDVMIQELDQDDKVLRDVDHTVVLGTLH